LGGTELNCRPSRCRVHSQHQYSVFAYEPLKREYYCRGEPQHKVLFRSQHHAREQGGMSMFWWGLASTMLDHHHGASPASCKRAGEMGMIWWGLALSMFSLIRSGARIMQTPLRMRLNTLRARSHQIPSRTRLVRNRNQEPQKADNVYFVVFVPLTAYHHCPDGDFFCRERDSNPRPPGVDHGVPLCSSLVAQREIVPDLEAVT